MNFFEARKILELESTYTVDDIKKNYRRLAMMWHPDKNPDPESTDRFAKINTAYQFLLKEESGDNTEPTLFDNFNFSDLLKTFTTVTAKTFQPIFFNNNKEITIDLTLSEYFLGCTKEIEVKEPCRCEKVICTTCAGCGYSIHGFVALQRQLNQCETCMGAGIRNVCGLCKLGHIGVKKPIEIPPRSRLDFTVEKNVRVKLNLIGGKYQDGKIIVPFDISLKASLTGFRKKFKDPFGDIHFVQVRKIVKPNDGYLIKMQYCTEILLVFNIIYPESLSQESVDKIRLIDF